MAYVPQDFQSGDVLMASQLNEMDAQILRNEAAAANRDFIANDYDPTATYKKGDMVIYNGTVQVATVDIPVAEVFAPSHWKLTTMDEMLKDLLATQADVLSALDASFVLLINGTNTTEVFRRWWPFARQSDSQAGKNRYDTLTRWFAILQKAWSGKKYTIRFNHYSVSGVTTATPLDDLTGKTAAICATEETMNDLDWADEDPMTWYLRFNGLSLADGTMNVLAVEGVDDNFDISGNIAPVYTGRLALFKKHLVDETYEYKSFMTVAEDTSCSPWAADVDPTGAHRVMNWQATFAGSKTSSGKLTSGSGFHGQTWERNANTPAISNSANAGIVAARLWDEYEGIYSDTDVEPIIDLLQLRHFDLENSGIIEGCLNYNLDYVVAFAETGVTSVVVTEAQGANILVGSFLDVGTTVRGGQIARGNVLRKEAITVEGTNYVRIHLDLPEAVNVTAEAHVASLPWTPGSTEHLPGHKDGSLYNCTDGKTPARIAGVEIIDGAYAVGLDPLWMSDYDETRSPKSIYTIHQVRDSEYQNGSIGSHHVESGTFESENAGWQYVKHLEIRNDGMIVPDAVGGSSTTYLKSAFDFGASSGVRAPWRFCNLYGGGRGGLAGAGGSSASTAGWYGRPRLSGSGKKRGEWAA